jgi:hypothetical protein
MSERQLLFHNLVSSIWFLLGSTTWTVSFFLTLRNDLILQIVSYVALLFLLMHGLLEICIDICYTRTAIHGRYNNHSCFNIFHSLVFVLGILSEAAASYLSYQDWGYSIYLWTYLAAAHLFFLTAVFTLFGRRCCIPGAGLDNISNTMFTLGTILMLVSAYETFFHVKGDDKFFAKWLGVFLWDVAATLSTGRDFLKLRRSPSKASKRQLLKDEEYDESVNYSSSYDTEVTGW